MESALLQVLNTDHFLMPFVTTTAVSVLYHISEKANCIPFGRPHTYAIWLRIGNSAGGHVKKMVNLSIK